LRVFENRVLRHVANTGGGGGEKNVYIVFVAEPEERIQFGKDRHRWEDNIKINHTGKK